MESFHTLVGIARVDTREDRALPAVHRLGQVPILRHPARDHDRLGRHLVGSAVGVVAERTQERRSLVDGIEDSREGHDGADRMEPEGEGRDDSEVPASAANRPEQIRVDVRRGHTHLTVGADDLRGDQVVARKPELAPKPAVPAAEREPGDTGFRYGAQRCRKPERLSLPVDVAEHRASLNACHLRLRVHLHGAHPREIHDHATLRARESSDRVSAPTHGELDPVLSGEVNGVDDIRRSRAAHDQARPVWVHRVEGNANVRIPA